MAYLRFDREENPGKKTCRWVISNAVFMNTIAPGSWIGFIDYRPTWRKYVWGTLNNAIFDVDCTQEIVDFLRLHAQDRQ